MATKSTTAFEKISQSINEKGKRKYGWKWRFYCIKWGIESFFKRIATYFGACAHDETIFLIGKSYGECIFCGKRISFSK